MHVFFSSFLGTKNVFLRALAILFYNPKLSMYVNSIGTLPRRYLNSITRDFEST